MVEPDGAGAVDGRHLQRLFGGDDGRVAVEALLDEGRELHRLEQAVVVAAGWPVRPQPDGHARMPSISGIGARPEARYMLLQGLWDTRVSCRRRQADVPLGALHAVDREHVRPKKADFAEQLGIGAAEARLDCSISKFGLGDMDGDEGAFLVGERARARSVSPRPAPRSCWGRAHLHAPAWPVVAADEARASASAASGVR